jgi:PAS domain S-box-containing protein
MKILFLLLLIYTSNLFGQENVTLQLAWKHQFQSAGYYMAKEKGFYSNAGLKVTIKEYTYGMNVTDEVVNSKAEFGIGRSSLIHSKLEGLPVVMLGAIFQHSPLVLISKKRDDITKITDFKNKKLMLIDDHVGLASINAMLLSYGIKPDMYTFQSSTFKIDDLIDGKTDVLLSYISNEPFALDKKNIEYSIFSPKEHGFDFYSDIIFTSQNILKQNPKIVNAFRKASLEGWKYAMEHPSQTIDLILSKYNTQNKTREALEFEANAMIDLIDEKNYPLGNINQQKIESNAQTYRLMGLTNKNHSLDDLIYDTDIKKKLEYSVKELEWIEQSKTIKYVYDIDWAPFEWRDKENNHKGIVKDLIDRISKESRIKFQAINSTSWLDAMKKAKSGQVDMYSGVGVTLDKKEYMNFSKKILSFPYVFVSRQNEDYLEGFEDTINKRVAVVKGYTIEGILKQYRPNQKLIEVENISEGLKKLQENKIDILISNKASASYYIRKHNIFDLKFAYKTDYTLDLTIALNKKIPQEVLSIINKAIDLIPREDIVSMQNQYLVDIEKDDVNYILFLKIISGAFLAFLVIVFWNRKLSSMIKLKTHDIEKQKEEVEDLMDSLDKNVLFSRTDLQGKIIHVSTSFCKISEYTKEELIGKTHNIVRHPDMKSEIFKNLWETIQSGKTWNGEIKNLKKNGGFYWVTASMSPELDEDGSITGYRSIRHDITAQKKVEDLTDNLEQKIESRTKELDEERKFIGSIISSSQDALIVIDKSSNVTVWNESATNIFGYTENEMIGASIEKIIPHHFRELHYAGVKRVSSNGERKLLGRGAIEIEATRKDSKVIPIDLALNTFMIDDTMFFSASIRDISERVELTKQQQELLIKVEDQKQFVQTLLDSQEQLIITTDGKTLISANETFLNFYTVDSAEHFKEIYKADCVCDTFNIKAPEGYLQKMMREETWIDYVISRSFGNNHKVMITKGDRDFIFSVSAAKLPGDNPLKSAVFTNITEMENIKLEIENINQHTKESIQYASLIQSALLPDNNKIRNYFKDYFVIWHPKDVVGGDIYLFEELREEDECLLMVIDCTGHGVPGAFVTMLVKAIERQIISGINHSKEDVSPAKILSIFNFTMRKLLKQDDSNSISNAGFDGQVLYYNKKENIIKTASARNEIFYYQDDELHVIKGDRHSIGYKDSDINYEFTEHTIDVSKETTMYLSTDGYWDQNGGEKGFPLGKKRFKKILDEYYKETMADQQEVFLFTLDDYKADEETNDDVTVIGLKI